MAEAVSDIGDREAGREHIDSARMPEAVRRVDLFEPFGGQGPGQIFLADAVNAVPGKFLSPLIDKDTGSIKRFGLPAVPGDVTVYELRGLWPKLDLSIPVSLAEQDQEIHSTQPSPDFLSSSVSQSVF